MPLLLKPGETLREVPDDGRILLAPGDGHRPIVIHARVKNLFIGPAVPTAAMPWIDGRWDHEGAEFGIRLNDGCEAPKIQGIGWKHCGHGLRVTKAPRLQLLNCAGRWNAVEGAHVAGCPEALISQCEFTDNGDPGHRWPKGDGDEYGLDQAHGLYLAADCSRARVLDCLLSRNRGSALQMNAASSREIMREVLVGRCVMEHNAAGTGSPAISLMGVCDSHFQQLYVNDDAGFATLFADDGGRKFACRGNVFRDYTVTGCKTSTPHELDGSGGNTFEPGAGWSPSAAPVPVPTAADPSPVRMVACPRCGGKGQIPA